MIIQFQMFQFSEISATIPSKFSWVKKCKELF